MDQTRCHSLTVHEVPQGHVGKGRVLLHHAKRDCATRHQIVKITETKSGKNVLASVIGRKEEEKDKIGLDFDLRQTLGLRLETKYSFEIRKVGIIGTLCWFMTVRDPIVRTAAWLAAISIGLSLINILLVFR